jgi:hypothetical protein
MNEERIKKIAEMFLGIADEGINFIMWDNIRNVLKGEEDVDEETLEILTDNVLDEIEKIADERGILYYYPGETYIYNTEYRRARPGGITIIRIK